jgi:hypothetical protein
LRKRDRETERRGVLRNFIDRGVHRSGDVARRSRDIGSRELKAKQLVPQVARSRGDEEAILGYRRLGPRELRWLVFELVRGEAARERGREIGISAPRISEFELRLFSARSEKEDNGES